jgi:hypothetical protein
VDGWYLGPAPDHYRCYRVHIKKTKSDIIVDTVEFFPAKVAMPGTASEDMAIIAAKELTRALCHNVAIKTITIHVIEVVISITTIITYLHNYI